MNTYHSPGPWKALRMDGGSHHIVSETWGSSVAVTMYPEGSNEREANARLIAAAPTMLEALEWMLAAHDNPDHAGADVATARARQALQAAKGE